MNALTDAEKAYYDTIRSVVSGARPRDLALMRMTLDGRDVAVIAQRVVRTADASTAGWQPLALIVDDEVAARLRSVSGDAPDEIAADGLEGA